MSATAPIRIGSKISPLAIAVWIGLSLLFAVLMTQVVVGGDISVASLGFGAGFFIVGLLGIGALVWRATPSRGSIDLTARTLTSGGRTIAFADLTRAYRIPGGENPGEFGIRLSIPRGHDVRMLVSSRSFTDATAAQLDAVITMVEASSISPDPRIPLRPPIGTAAENRTEDQQHLDAMSGIIMFYDETAYTRETLLAELRRAREILVHADGKFPWAAASDGDAKVAGILAGLSRTGLAATRLPSGGEVATIGTPTVDYARGFFGTLSARYKGERTRVENWLRETDPTFMPDKHGRIAAAGWATLVVMFFWPVISLVLFNVLLYLTFQFIGSVIFIGLVVTFSPFIIYMGIVLIWLARVRRHSSLRRSVLAAKATREVPQDIRDFFGSPHPEGYIEMPRIFLWAIVWVLALAGGITMIAIGANPLPGQGLLLWYWIPIGAVLAIGSLVRFPAFVGLMKRRSVTSVIGELEHRLLA